MVLDFGFRPTWFHTAASSGILYNREYKKDIGNLARCGISLYGIDPWKKETHLQQVLIFKTILNQIKTLKKGEKVGYDFTFTAKKNMTIGIVPAGYYDGVDRRLSNKGFVTIKNTYCPIIGRVSMNVTTIDVSNVEKLKIGDEVIIFSDKIENKNSIMHAATLADTIPYDLVVRLAASTKRIVV